MHSPTRTTVRRLDDYRWLVGPEAAAYLAELAAAPGDTLEQAERLRQSFSPPRVHLLLEQVELRRRGAEKFSRAECMFFTRLGLEQATDEVVARYKAERFPVGEPLVDLCCGVGGDLLALARRGPVLGVDRDAAALLLAQANARSRADDGGVSTCATSAAPWLVGRCAAWHIDPDRRPAGRRTTRVELHEPNLDVLQSLLRECPHAAIKLAPAAEPPDAWIERAELEWISRGGVCRQLVAWHGRLARAPGERGATVLSADGGARRTVVGEAEMRPAFAARLGSYLHEPDAAVLAAGLTGALAHEHGLAAIAPGVAYLTGDGEIKDGALATFEIVETLPLDMKRIKALLRDRRIGRLEIKKRGVPHDPAAVRRQLSVPGDEAATLFLTRLGAGRVAILARRCKRVSDVVD